MWYKKVSGRICLPTTEVELGVPKTAIFENIIDVLKLAIFKTITSIPWGDIHMHSLTFLDEIESLTIFN